jgi:hypothetical protein
LQELPFLDKLNYKMGQTVMEVLNRWLKLEEMRRLWIRAQWLVDQVHPLKRLQD